jgi:hypothetical protein
MLALELAEVQIALRPRNRLGARGIIGESLRLRDLVICGSGEVVLQ